MDALPQTALDADRFRLMVESAPNAVIMVDEQGRLAYINRQTEKLFGYPREELLGQPLERLVPDSVRDRHPDLRRGYFRSPSARNMGSGRDLYGQTRDGRRIPVEIGLNPIDTAQGRFVAASIIDITERRRAEEVLRLQVAETLAALERLQEAQKQLVQSEKMASLGALVAGVAHEINTPVGVGVTAASHLADEIARVRAAAANNQLTRSQFNDFLELSQQSSRMILSNLARAVELIQSFKRVAVDQSTDERRTITISEYLKEILLSLRPKLKQLPHRVEVECPEGLQLRTVPGAWSQIITNLVLNAYSHAFTPERPGRVRISVSQHEQELLLCVEDDGLGIARDILPRIFDPFFTTKRGHGGTGLGLNIVYNLVSQTLGGSIEVSSEPGQGTRFSIRLPYQA